MQHYVSELIDLLLVLVAAWTVLAVIFVIYAYFARLKYPVSESVFGRVVVGPAAVQATGDVLGGAHGRPRAGSNRRRSQRVRFSINGHSERRANWLRLS